MGKADGFIDERDYIDLDYQFISPSKAQTNYLGLERFY